MAELDLVVASIGQAIADEVADLQALAPAGALAAYTVQVMAGWPTAEDLNAALAAGRVQISVHPRAGMNTSEARRLDGWTAMPATPATMTATVGADEKTVTLAGTGQAGQRAAILADGRSWIVDASGTPAQVAALLAAAVDADRAATAAGAVVTLGGTQPINLRARVVPSRGERRVLGEDQQGIQITIWAPSVAARDLLTPVVNLWARRTQFLDLAGDEQARLIYGGKMTDDDARQSGMHRRDVLLTAVFSASEIREQPVTVVGEVPIEANGNLIDTRPALPVRLTMLVGNGIVLPTLTRAQPDGALAAALSAPGVMRADYAANAPRFPLGGGRLLVGPVAATQLLLNSDVMTTRTITVPAGQYFFFSFMGTGTLRVSTPLSSIFDHAAGGTNALFFDYVGLGATVQQGGAVQPSGTSLTFTVTGDVRFCMLHQTGPRYDAANRYAPYAPASVAPATIGADLLGDLSFPTLFPTGEGTIVLSVDCSLMFQNTSFVTLSIFNTGATKTLAFAYGYQAGAYILTYGAAGAGPLFGYFGGAPYPSPGARITTGCTFTRAGRLASKRAGDPTLQSSTGGLDFLGVDTVRIGPPNSNPFGLNGPMQGAIMAGYLPYAAPDALLATLVDTMHATP